MNVYDNSDRYEFRWLSKGWTMMHWTLTNGGDWKIVSMYNSSALRSDPFKRNSQTVFKAA